MSKARLARILYGVRPAGWGSSNPPPDRYIGELCEVGRLLINECRGPELFWCTFIDGKKFVIAREELDFTASSIDNPSSKEAT